MGFFKQQNFLIGLWDWYESGLGLSSKPYKNPRWAKGIRHPREKKKMKRKIGDKSLKDWHGLWYGHSCVNVDKYINDLLMIYLLLSYKCLSS